LQQNNGVDPAQLAAAQGKVASAQNALDQAQTDLGSATLKAPFDGTITSIAGKVGDTVTTDPKNTSATIAANQTFITIDDLAHPLLQFSMDETDLDKIAVGEKAIVVFDSLSHQTFNGTVTRLDPSLNTSSGYKTVTGLIQVDFSAASSASTLQEGSTATIQIVHAQVTNALLIPVIALHEAANGDYAVYVVGSNGQMQLQTVQVGVEDAVNAEITSGLTEGQAVSIGNVQTK